MIEEKKPVKIVGAGNISTGRATLDEYSMDVSFINPAMPEYVIKPRNAEDIARLVNLVNEAPIEVKFGVPHHKYSDATHDLYGSCCHNYQKLMRKVKKNFDPAVLSRDSLYITAKDE